METYASFETMEEKSISKSLFIRFGDRINIIDGAHRAIILALRGVKLIETYLGD